MMLKILLWSFLLFEINAAQASFLCTYKCDSRKGNYDAKLIIKNNSSNLPKCIAECSYTNAETYYCEFFSEIALSNINLKSIQLLANNLIMAPEDKGTELSSKNNKLYKLLRNFHIKNCTQHIKLMSLKLTAKSSKEIHQNLEELLKIFKQVFETKYPQFKNYPSSQKIKENPSILTFDKARNLFDWCQSYCTIARTAKTSRSFKRFVQENSMLNTTDLIDKIRNHTLLFSHSKYKYVTRAYKCLSQCSIEKTKDYICYLLDTIDAKNDTTEASRTIIDLIAQIMMKSSIPKREGETMLDKYLKNSQYKEDCLKNLRKYYYRGNNYAENIKYIDSVYRK
jgi:hypothetical protein